MFSIATVLGFLPTIMKYVGKGVGATSFLTELVSGFDGRPADQARLKAEIDRLASENDEGHARLQAKLAAAALK